MLLAVFPLSPAHSERPLQGWSLQAPEHAALITIFKTNDALLHDGYCQLVHLTTDALLIRQVTPAVPASSESAYPRSQ